MADKVPSCFLLPDLESLGLIVSQLHVNFGCIAACVPTVLKLFEEGLVALGGRIRFLEKTLGASQQKSEGSGRGSTAIRLSALHKSADRSGASGGGHNSAGGGRRKTPVVGPYLNAGCDDDDEGSMGSQQRIISSTGGNIKVQTEVYISVETDRGGAYSEADGGGHGHGHGRFTSSAFRG